MTGGVGEPAFCVLSESTTIETPHFSFTTPSESLVGVDRDGARAVIQGSLWQSGIHLLIEAYPLTDQDKLMRQLGRCGDLAAGTESVLTCDQSTDDVVRITQLFLGTERIVLSELSAVGTGFAQLPDYKATFESIVPE
jgi:hypothetical protein